MALNVGHESPGIAHGITTPHAARKAMAQAMAQFTNDPLGWVMFAFPWGVKGGPLETEDGPDVWQRRELQHIGDSLEDDPFAIIRRAVASGHGIGKSALVAWLILWAITTYPDMRGRVTANTETQLTKTTWTEVSKWYELLNPVLKAQFHYSPTALHSTAPGHEKTWRIDAVPWNKNNPAGFAGLHNAGKRILIVFDEASEIHDVIWDTMEGATTDADTQIIWCAFGNPTQNTGRFKEVIAGSQRHLWGHAQIDSRKVKRTNKDRIAAWIVAFGEDSDFVRIRVKGMFPRTGETQFMPEDVVLAARERKPAYIPSDPIIFGLDIARHGSDESVLAVRRGRDAQTMPWKRWRVPNLMDLAGLVALEIAQWKPDAVFIDVTGMGWGVYDRLMQLGHLACQPINFGDPGGLADFNGVQVRTAFKVDAMWTEMREWMRGGSIPDESDLHNELIARNFSFNSANELRLEAKDHMKARGVPSPDQADALALTFAMPVAPRPVQVIGHGHGFQSVEIGLQNTWDIHADL